jgi:hypothetical protein
MYTGGGGGGGLKVLGLTEVVQSAHRTIIVLYHVQVATIQWIFPDGGIETKLTASLEAECAKRNCRSFIKYENDMMLSRLIINYFNGMSASGVREVIRVDVILTSCVRESATSLKLFTVS